MVNLNMIDTIGSGIRRSFGIQRDRNFPMPTYDLSDAGRVKVRVFGEILDPNYTRMLMSQTSLDLFDVIGLDKVQKKVPISDAEYRSLKSKKLIEGRRPKLHVSADVAAATDSIIDYLNRRGIDKEYCQRMIIELLQKRDDASRQEIESLLVGKLSDVLDDGQKSNFVQNVLQEMRRDGRIVVNGFGKGARWSLV
jgi:ATP-dependent DNA helicase RecG